MIGPAIGGFLGGIIGFDGPFWFGAVTGAAAALFLASSDADYITAQTLNVDGGNWMS